jgi:acyl phosphate:glycerol-3-phosphate acyltransferase
MVEIIIGVVLSYFIGAIPMGYIVGRLVKNIDIRTCGSGNVGATNVFRTVGKKWGIGVLLFDAFKGFAAVSIVPLVIHSDAMSFSYIQFAYGCSSIIGHNWPVFLKFRGGKGVATTCGVLLGMFPKALLVCFLLFVIVVSIFRYISLGSITASLFFPLSYWIFYHHDEKFLVFFCFSLFLMLSIIYRHRSNIKRLFERTEHKIIFR